MSPIKNPPEQVCAKQAEIFAAVCAIESVESPTAFNNSWSTGPNGKQDPDD